MYPLREIYATQLFYKVFFPIFSGFHGLLSPNRSCDSKQQIKRRVDYLFTRLEVIPTIPRRVVHTPTGTSWDE